MFEAKPLQPHNARTNGLPVEEGEALHSMTWQDLVARLSAARDLRVELAATSDGEGSSFDADFARCLAAQTKDLISVNPDNSGNHKGIEGIQHETADKATQDPRA